MGKEEEFMVECTELSNKLFKGFGEAVNILSLKHRTLVATMFASKISTYAQLSVKTEEERAVIRLMIIEGSDEVCERILSLKSAADKLDFDAAEIASDALKRANGRDA